MRAPIQNFIDKIQKVNASYLLEVNDINTAIDKLTLIISIMELVNQKLVPW